MIKKHKKNKAILYPLKQYAVVYENKKIDYLINAILLICVESFAISANSAMVKRNRARIIES